MFWSHGSGTNILSVIRKGTNKSSRIKKCWSKVKDTIPDNELFHLFDKAYGQSSRSGKDYFVKDIMRRSKAMGEPVRVRGILAAVCLLGRLTSSRLETY